MNVGTVERDKDKPRFDGWPGYSMPLVKFLVATLTDNTTNLSYSFGSAPYFVLLSC